MITNFNKLFEDNKNNIYDVDKYKVIYEVDFKNEISSVLKDLDLWCSDYPGFIPTERMVKKIIDNAMDFIKQHGHQFETELLYDNTTFEDYFLDILVENFSSELLKIKYFTEIITKKLKNKYKI